jgi:hypothetical protein
MMVCSYQNDDDDSLIRLLLAAGASIDHRKKDGISAVYLCAEQQHNTGLSLLLGAKADAELADGEGWTPLMRAAQNGDESGVVVLLQAGADRTVKNLEGDTALQITHKHGHVGVAVSLASNVLASPALVKPSLAVGLPKQAGKRPKQALDRALKPNTGASVAREDYDPPSLRRAVAGAPRSQDCCRRIGTKADLSTNYSAVRLFRLFSGSWFRPY